VTERLPISPASLALAAERIRQGGLVAFPTETVYGLGARADDDAAVRSIFLAKGRPPGNPLIVHVPRAASARSAAAHWPEAAETLAAAFWPGPLTLVVERRLGRGGVVPEATAGGPTVALRVPAHPVALALLEAADLPIAAPSANRSTTISPTTADHVLKSLDGRVDLILDGGPTGLGIESSIVDVTRTPAVLLRQGALSFATLAALVPLVDHSGGVVPEGERAAAPGGHARHYAPRARLLLLAPDAVHGAVEALRAGGTPIGSLEQAPGTVSTGPREILPSDPAGYAAGLYAALHRLEDAGSSAIVVGVPPEGDPWAAVHDRLQRAAVPEK
jgi:L-threonylcarbamoyladenylate synthase